MGDLVLENHDVETGWDRRGWVRDGVRLYTVGLGVLVSFAVIEWAAAPSAIGPGPLWLRAASGAIVVALAALAREQVRRVLARREALVPTRERASRITLAGYVVLAAAVVLVGDRIEAYPLALVAGGLAMTSPGVFLVVWDGSPAVRGALRVALAAGLVPLATVAGYVVGIVAFFVSTFVGSFVFGVLAGHLVTFLPLALVGPGPNRRRA